MFTGIIETLAVIKDIEQFGTTLRFRLETPIAQEFKVDQSICHDGVCLTIVEVQSNCYAVDVIDETLQKTRLLNWQKGDVINLERSVTINTLLDGHIVQGHVDRVLTCIKKEEKNGSWLFTFSYPKEVYNLLIPRGSICINGISLTIAQLTDEQFTVAIIPYTFTHTNMSHLQVGDEVNVEFDVIGKYLQRMMK